MFFGLEDVFVFLVLCFPFDVFSVLLFLLDSCFYSMSPSFSNSLFEFLSSLSLSKHIYIIYIYDIHIVYIYIHESYNIYIHAYDYMYIYIHDYIQY